MHSCVILCHFSSSEWLYRWPCPLNFLHKPGGSTSCDGVRAVWLHCSRPGNDNHRSLCALQSEGKAPIQVAV